MEDAVSMKHTDHTFVIHIAQLQLILARWKESGEVPDEVAMTVRKSEADVPLELIDWKFVE